MKNKLPLKFYWLFLCEFLFRFMAWAVIPFVLLFARKANMEEIKDKIPYGVGKDIQRYVFPKYLECFEMIDDYNWPEYETTMSNIRKKWGWAVATYINLAFRNVGMSLTAQLAKECSGYWYTLSDEEKEEKGLFDNHYHFLGLTLKVGYVSYRNWKNYKNLGMYVAVPRITLRIKEKEIAE